ncbi:MAG: hypothetical protein KF851_10855 [Pirellulaceae bacterium]|nr:hypothetical protein [Pirellulaceae bacterium]
MSLAYENPTFTSGHLAWLIERFTHVVQVFSTGLSEEFWPDNNTLEDWADNLAMLREALFPIALAVEGLAVTDTGHQHREHYASTKCRLVNAIKSLNEALDCCEEKNSEGNNCRSAASFLVKSYEDLEQAIAVLKNWSKIFPSNSAVAPVGFAFSPSENVLQELLKNRIDELEDLIHCSEGSNGDALSDVLYQLCMKTRKLFFTVHYVSVLSPQLCDEQLRQKVLGLLNEAIELNALSEGSPYRTSVVKRWRRIQSSPIFFPDGF